jgi:uncharacterized membrane protein
MDLPAGARILLAASFAVFGLVETLNATGLSVLLSPDGRWASGVHTLAVSGPLQMVGAAFLAAGRKTRWTLRILGCYLVLVGVFGNVPLVFDPALRASAIAGLLANLVLLSGIVFYLRQERSLDTRAARPALRFARRMPAWPFRALVGLAIMAGILYWLHGQRAPDSHGPGPAVPIATPAPASQVTSLA